MTAQLAFDALILAGGGARRLGGLDKSAVTVAGQSLAERALGACRGATKVIVVAPESVHFPPVPGQELVQVCEDPPGGGPVAGILAGLPLVSAPWLLVLAVDQPAAAEAVPALVAAAFEEERGELECGSTESRSTESADTGRAGKEFVGRESVARESSGAAGLICHRDGDGFPQWLLGMYRVEALRAAAEGFGSGHSVSVRRLASRLVIREVTEASEALGDLDTWEDHRRWQERLE